MNPLAGTAATAEYLVPASPFAGTDICREAGLSLPPGAARPAFEDDEWDFTHVTGLPIQLDPGKRRFDFTPISDQRWKLVAKELTAALLAPRHEAVAPLPRAYRTPAHIGTAKSRLDELTRLLNWLTQQGIRSLGEVDDDCCAAWLDYRRHARDEAGTVIGGLGPATQRAAAQVVIDLVSYRELFTTDRLRQDLRPWKGASASVVAGMPPKGENKTSPAPSHLLQPLLAAALYVTSVLGPCAPELAAELRQAATLQTWAPERPDNWELQNDPLVLIQQVLTRHRQDHEPLPELPGFLAQRRPANGWDPGDPLLTVNLAALAREAELWKFRPEWLPLLRPQIEETLAATGVAGPFGRSARTVTAASGEELPWTVPLQREEATALIGVIRAAAIIVTLAVTGMRISEVMELQVGARQPPQEAGPGLTRYRSPATSSRDSRWVAPATSGSSSSPSTRPSALPSSSTTTPATRRSCSAGSPSPGATRRSATGSTARPASGSAWPPSPTTW